MLELFVYISVGEKVNEVEGVAAGVVVLGIQGYAVVTQKTLGSQIGWVGRQSLTQEQCMRRAYPLLMYVVLVYAGIRQLGFSLSQALNEEERKLKSRDGL